MKTRRHFMIFRRTANHCSTWLVRAPSLRDALLQYIEDQHADVREDGTFAGSDGYSGQIIYKHPLACIEEWEKTSSGSVEGWSGWEIREVREQHWQADFAEVFCSENPYEVEEHIERCRSLLRLRYPRSRARGFVWYLEGGPLVTFYRPARRGRRHPIEIMARYYTSWAQWPDAQEWKGTYDTILEQMWLESPYWLNILNRPLKKD